MAENKENKPSPSAPLIPLAREIPKYRQERLAGRSYVGPMTNIAPLWSQLNAPGALAVPTTSLPVKGQTVLASTQPQTSPAPLPDLDQTEKPSTLPPLDPTSVGKQRQQEQFIAVEVQKLHEKLQQKEVELQQLRDQGVQQKTQMETLKSDQRASVAVIQNLRQKLANIEGDESRNQEVEVLRQKISVREQENNRLKQEIDKLHQSLSEEQKLEQEVSTYKQQLQQLSAQHAQLKVLVQKEEEKIALQEQNQKKQQQQSQRQHHLLDQLSHEKESSASTIQHLKEELIQVQKTSQDSEKTQALQQAINQKEQENKELKYRIEALEQSLKQGERQGAEVSSYRTKVDELTKREQELQTQIQQEEKRLSDLMKKLEETSKENVTKESQIKQLEKLIEETVAAQSGPLNTAKPVVKANLLNTPKVPVLTTQPNSISGVVTDTTGRFVPDAIVIIKDAANHNLRALKTNTLGQFVATSPLQNGQYYIEAGKPGLSFDTIEVELTGGVHPPIEISSHESVG